MSLFNSQNPRLSTSEKTIFAWNIVGMACAVFVLLAIAYGALFYNVRVEYKTSDNTIDIDSDNMKVITENGIFCARLENYHESLGSVSLNLKECK